MQVSLLLRLAHRAKNQNSTFWADSSFSSFNLTAEGVEGRLLVNPNTS
jgi:hypothetical protein